MGMTRNENELGVEHDKFLTTLQSLLEIRAVELKGALDQASDLIAQALEADKVDAFLCDPSIDSLVALGTSNTPMARRQREIGMDRLPIVGGGRVVGVFQTGEPYITGRADEDPVVLVGFTRGLGIRSMMGVVFDVGEERRGVLHAASARVDVFSEKDLRFLQAVARWVGMVAQRAELTERIARDAAEQARRLAAEELVTVLAHDFRNHLTPLQARIDLIRNLAEREGNRKYLDHAYAAKLALGRLRKLSTDLLDVGRLDQGIFALSLQPVDVVALVKETVDELGAGEPEIIVRAPEDLVAEIDPHRVRQALENLLANAMRFSPRGVPVIVEVEEETREDGRRAGINVRDGGPGIPPELLPTLFSRFASGTGSTGLGLGLYLARGIAEAHGGTLTVESRLGEGATFRLKLPSGPQAITG